MTSGHQPALAPPPLDGVHASRLRLPQGPWRSLLAGLHAHFPQVSRSIWEHRFAAGKILDEASRVLPANTAYRPGTLVYYYREVPAEAEIDEVEEVLYADEHLLVADKPHGLPVVPAGSRVRQTLLARLVRRFDNPHLAPLHRIDRDTAGLVLFSTNPRSRAAYHALFAKRMIDKRYLAIALALDEQTWPLSRRSRLERGEPFFRMHEVDGLSNSETRIEPVAKHGQHWSYALSPITGRKHQLRVHMSALGAPICGDCLYPQIVEPDANQPANPLQLLAQSLSFIDPISQRAKSFRSNRRLLLAQQ